MPDFSKATPVKPSVPMVGEKGGISYCRYRTLKWGARRCNRSSLQPSFAMGEPLGGVPRRIGGLGTFLPKSLRVRHRVLPQKLKKAQNSFRHIQEGESRQTQ